MKRTVQEVIDTIIAAVPGAPYPETVDTLKTGDPGQKVRAIATTFLASYDVIQRVIASGANLVITHEPTFYGHLDNTIWLESDPVYKAKRALIDSNHIAIWRFHDYLHSLTPDPTFTGLVKALGWSAYTLDDQPFVCQLPERTLGQLVQEIKSRLGLESVRVVGDPGMNCSRAGLVVGAPGGEMQISGMGSQALDVLICGEINEWEISEYARDAAASGLARALVVIGHSASEEDGMREIVPWLQQRLPDVPVSFIPTGPALRTV
jgi:putative NIF3 family GTP cyclohydrolase 1 type 2